MLRQASSGGTFALTQPESIDVCLEDAAVTVLLKEELEKYQVRMLLSILIKAIILCRPISGVGTVILTYITCKRQGGVRGLSYATGYI